MGFNATVRIENFGEETIHDWAISFDNTSKISNIWNATIVSYTDDKYVIKNAGYNQDIDKDGFVEFGMTCEKSFERFPEYFELLGEIAETCNSEYEIVYNLKEDWIEGYCGYISINNTSDTVIEDWVLEFDFGRNITNIWNATIVEKEDNHYTIRNAGYNGNIVPGESVTIGFIGTNGKKEDDPKGYHLFSYVMKPVNGNNNGINTEEVEENTEDLDTDLDGLPDSVELEFGTDLTKTDTDGDGLSDYTEIYFSMTDPKDFDSDDNGVNDGKEDLDDDGLINIDELACGTDIACADTDGDNLTDYDEICVFYSDPNNEDTDGDGLSDYDDVKLGFSPLYTDTDNNGVADADEYIYQTIEKDFSENGNGITKVEVSTGINGNIENQIGILDISEFDSMSKDVVGLFGVPVEIRCKSGFDTAVMKFTYDDSMLGDTDEENLALMWYDEENNWYQILDRECVVDTENNTVSYETTHFSTYMLVDRKEWYNAWREDIDYRISETGDRINKFDIAFVVDTSGSMSGSRMSNAKNALIGFIESMNYDDEAAIISFNNYATLKCDFTSDQDFLRQSVKSLYADGGTRVNNGLLKAIGTFENRVSERKKIIVLICDGDVSINSTTISSCVNNEICVYAINLESEWGYDELQKITNLTHGQYYYSETANELSSIFATIEDNTIGEIDKTDTDGDGLYDIFETAGIRLPNGRVIYTDKKNKDTDGDKLTDYQETGIIYNIDDRYIGYGVSKRVKYFVMRCNPLLPDTDGDSIKDKDDPNPTMAEKVSDNLYSNFYGVEYLNIDGSSCGDQGWWKRRVKEELWNEREIVFNEFMKSKDYRTWRLGCGLIAISDVELYLMQRYNGYSSPLQSIAYDKNTGNIKKVDYMKYVDNNREKRYLLEGTLLYYAVGVLPMDMEYGLDLFLKSYGYDYDRVKWAPYSGGRKNAKLYIADRVEKMINKNIPIVFSYEADDKKPITLYYNEKSAIDYDASDSTDTNHHYMTVLGYTKMLRDDEIDYRYILKVASWGRIYYIDFDEYSKEIDYYSNILEVK